MKFIKRNELMPDYELVYDVFTPDHGYIGQVRKWHGMFAAHADDLPQMELRPTRKAAGADLLEWVEWHAA